MRGGQTSAAGRSMARANLKEGEDPNPQKTMQLEDQHLPDRIVWRVSQVHFALFHDPFRE